MTQYMGTKWWSYRYMYLNSFVNLPACQFGNIPKHKNVFTKRVISVQLQYSWVLAVSKKASSQFILISSVKVTVKFKQNILAGGMKLVGVLKLSKLRGTKKII